MKKILFVEDELSQNVNRILNLFDKILSGQEKKGLMQIYDNQAELLKNGITSYIENSEISNVLRENPVLDVVFSFTDAIEILASGECDMYELFIIDRNLSCVDYDLETIKKIFPEFTEDMQIQYLEREGDFLFTMLKGKVDLNGFYFYTANANDALRCKEVFAEAAMLKQFTSDNVLDKSNQEHGERLLRIIEDFRAGNHRSKMRGVFEVFQNGLLTDKDEGRLTETLRRMTEDNRTAIEDNLGRIRRLLEAVYIELAKRKPDIVPADKIKYDRDQLQMGGIFKHLKESGAQPDFINSLSWDIWKICSEYGAHSQTERRDVLPSKYTVQAMVYSLCELLLWFKSVVETADD